MGISGGGGSFPPALFAVGRKLMVSPPKVTETTSATSTNRARDFFGVLVRKLLLQYASHRSARDIDVTKTENSSAEPVS